MSLQRGLCTWWRAGIEMRAMHRAPEWAKRNVKVIGLSANDLKDHERWVQDINDFGSKTVGPTDVQFPIVSQLCPCGILLYRTDWACVMWGHGAADRRCGQEDLDTLRHA